MIYLSPKNVLKAVALLVVIVLAGASTVHSLGYQTDHQQAESILRADYAEYNAKWFAGTLPTNTVVHYDTIPNEPTHEPAMGLTFADGDHLVIYIDPAYYHHNRKAAEITLMHELCHVSRWSNSDIEPHGPEFQGCMQRLSESGAMAELW